MSDAEARQYFQRLWQYLMPLQQEQTADDRKDVVAAFEGLQVLYEEMTTQLEAAGCVEQELMQQNQQFLSHYQRYNSLYLTLPIACLVTDPNGLILEANEAIAHLLNMPRSYLIGKPLALYVAESDLRDFRTALNQLSCATTQTWEFQLVPRNGAPVAMQWSMAIARQESGWTEALQIGFYPLSRLQPSVLPSASGPLDNEVPLEMSSPTSPGPTVPPALDGLHVLVVDDERDAREFVTAVLESHGICVTAVASASAALATLEHRHPDVLLSDIRMPNGDGYHLIQHVRALEAAHGGHIPAAAMTAYFTEDREKALTSGFEAYWHKLAQPTELVAVVAQLVRQG